MTQLELNNIKEKYKPGTRIVLDYMNDTQAPPKGTKGTIIGVDDIGDLLVTWDNGSNLNLIPSEDKFRIIDK